MRMGFAMPHPGLRNVAPPELAITGVGLPHDGKPTIILQAPPDGQGRGIVLHVQRDYSDGPEGLAKAIRKADPSYDPKKDRDLRVDDCPDCPRTPNSDSNCCVQLDARLSSC